MRTTIQKRSGDWIVGYIAEDGINHYVTHAKTKEELIHRLTEMVINSSQR